MSVTENAIGLMRGAKGAVPAKLDSGASAVLESMADATADMATRIQLQEQSDAAKPRPKANMKAEAPDEAYPLDILIGKDILQYVPTLDWSTDAKNNKAVRVESRFIASRIQPIASSKSTEKLKILRYLYILLQFYMNSKSSRSGRMLPKRDEMKKKLAGIPEPIVENVQRRFSDAGSIPKFKTDLLLTHICALACWVDNFEVDMFELRQDLKLEQKEMSQYFQEIGARIGALPEAMRKSLGLEKAQAAQRKIAKLKIPLEFPKIPFARKAR